MRFFSAVALVSLALGGAASAGPGLLLGVADDDLKWTEDTKTIVANQQAVGFKAVRVTLRWTPGQVSLDDDGRTYVRRAQVAAKLGYRVVVGIFGDAESPPVTPESRKAYCSYAIDALSRARNVDDVVIWNEANSALFWRQQKDAAWAYEALLADCYDMLHKYRRTVNVITSTSPHEDPARFIRDLGTAYRTSGRTLPLFDTFGHNAYPEQTRESPYATHPTLPSLDQGDYVRLVQVLTAAFDGTAQPLPGSGSINTVGTRNRASTGR
jgi:archaeosine-15-forming tRNA-guanine transglycosylase